MDEDDAGENAKIKRGEEIVENLDRSGGKE